MVATLFCLHALGSSGRSFETLAAELASTANVHPIDLPGFGTVAELGAATVAEMVDYVVSVIAEAGAERWYLLGHSMGGKIATLVAARGLPGFQGIVLLAASPPSPEPMEDDRRERMLSWLEGTGRLGKDTAREFIDANIGAPLPSALDAVAMQDLLRTSGEAWAAWLRDGSREDWSDRLRSIDAPAVVISGGQDGDLGSTAQQRLNGPFYQQARFVTLPGAGHLLPLERPQEVAEQIRALLT